MIPAPFLGKISTFLLQSLSGSLFPFFALKVNSNAQAFGPSHGSKVAETPQAKTLKLKSKPALLFVFQPSRKLSPKSLFPPFLWKYGLDFIVSHHTGSQPCGSP